MKTRFAIRLLAALLLLELAISLKAQQEQWFFREPQANTVKPDHWDPHFRRHYLIPVPDMAADCALEPTGENYTGVKYKAVLVADELSETGWVLLFGGSGFTVNGEYQPHFIDLMIKAGWASLYDDPLCARGFPPVRETWDNFTVEFGLSDYEDPFYGWIHENDIAAWTQDPQLFPRRYSNIDSVDPQAPDKIMAEYQVDRGGTLEGREIEVSFIREEITSLSQEMNYFMDPDLEGGLFCQGNSQDDILYRHWIATLKVPSLGIDSSVDFYINASQGDKINGNFYPLNFMWENPGRPTIESDRFKVIIFDPEVRTTAGEWERATRFLVDYRTPQNELPLNRQGELVGGYRKVNYKGRATIEASFGYGYTDYVIDGNPNDYEPTNATKGVIDLRYPVPHARVLFDEAHSEWTSISGNWQAFADDLRVQGYAVERHATGPLTADLLANFDVVVVGTAWGDFTTIELDAIQQFVTNGGGLFLTGLGWSWVNPDLGRTLENYPMNRIATCFDLWFLDDAICDPTSHYPNGTDCTPLFSAMAVHPIASQLTTVGGPITPSPVKRLSSTPQAIIFGDADAYSNGGHYPVGTNPPVVVAVEHGTGRVIALGHEAYLTTDDYDGDGNPNWYDYDNVQLGRNIIDWLAGGGLQIYLPVILRNYQ
jgi:hypothetical protein